MKTFSNARGALDTHKKNWGSPVILSKKGLDVANLLQKWILSVACCNVRVNLQPFLILKSELLIALQASSAGSGKPGTYKALFLLTEIIYMLWRNATHKRLI